MAHGSARVRPTARLSSKQSRACSRSPRASAIVPSVLDHIAMLRNVAEPACRRHALGQQAERRRRAVPPGRRWHQVCCGHTPRSSRSPERWASSSPSSATERARSRSPVASEAMAHDAEMRRRLSDRLRSLRRSGSARLTERQCCLPIALHVRESSRPSRARRLERRCEPACVSRRCSRLPRASAMRPRSCQKRQSAAPMRRPVSASPLSTDQRHRRSEVWRARHRGARATRAAGARAAAGSAVSASSA